MTKLKNKKISINCDLGEGYGIYRLCDDEQLLPFVTDVNIACGFHASDPNIMKRTVELAKKHKVNVGAHFSLPDRAGFGRREMAIDYEELKNIITYQIGALGGFLEMSGIKLHHLKPHGALYGMSARNESTALAISAVADFYKVPILGLAGTFHEKVYVKKRLKFQPEFFADLDYSDEGEIIITRYHEKLNPSEVAKKCLLAIEEGVTKSISGNMIPITFSTICIHSDTPNSVSIAKSVYDTIKKYL